MLHWLRHKFFTRHPFVKSNSKNIAKRTSPISCGWKELDDRFLGGGLKPGQCLDIFGQSGVGKTQLCLSAVAELLVSSPQACVMYIDSGNGGFSWSRLLEIVQSKCSQSSDVQMLSLEDCQCRVTIERCFDIHSASECLLGVFKVSNIELIVLDSMADLLPCFYSDEKDRSKCLAAYRMIQRQLQVTSERLSCTLMVTLKKRL